MFPADAGMNQGGHAGKGKQGHVPRGRGDEPRSASKWCATI